MERLIRTGKVRTYSSAEITHSRIGIGFEKLDRGMFDPEKAYDKVAATGAKWVRIQSGWARTEQEKGVYSFEWLDRIVDNLIRRGMRPWICLCYGNGLYDEEAAKIFGAVGHPPRTEEQYRAWDRYIKAVVSRYRGKVQWYEVWNEPDGVWCWKTGPNGTDYGHLVLRTAEAIRAADPDAKVIGGSQCLFGLAWLHDVLATGAGKVMDAFSYHNYAADERGLPALVAGSKALLHQYNPAIKLIQGETGTQSRSGGAGALNPGAWTPLRQAKYMARHTITDFMSDIMFNSYFSCMDMCEALDGIVGNISTRKDYGYFGILAAEFDEDGIASGNFTPKISYRTFQVLCSVFQGNFEKIDLPLNFRPHSASPRAMFQKEPESAEMMFAGFQNAGGKAFAYWKPVDLLRETYAGTCTIHTCMKDKVRLVDLLDGSVYELPQEMDGIHDSTLYKGSREFLHLPLLDYPLLLTFGDFCSIDLNP